MSFVVKGMSSLQEGFTTVLHLKNISTRRKVAISEVEYQVGAIDGTRQYPNPEHFFVIGLDRDYASGGELSVPINTDRTSDSVAMVTCFTDSPEVSGEALEVGRWHTKEYGTVHKLDESITLGSMDTIELAYHGMVNGFISARIKFEMTDGD